tara:strand:+ start:47 stop:682 length:636 start_codon:yes stop_codon:yes gene_type:complete
MVKIFDLEPGGLKDGGQASLNKEESEKYSKQEALKKEHEETNKGLAIELRNKIAANMMRVEFPKEVIEEIKEGIENLNSHPNEEFRNNLENIFKQIGKTFLKKCYGIEKQLKIDFRLYSNHQNISSSPENRLDYDHKIKALLFTDGGNSFDFQWNSVELHDHPLRPDNFETVTTEPGVLIIYPSYNKINSAPPQEYLDKSPVIEVGIDYEI